MLVGTCLGLFILMLDSTVVALALPTIERELHASADNVQWVLNGYLLVISVLVVTAGRLGDISGRRRIFLIGMAVFGAGSVLAALASDDAVLVAARVIQGAGGAAMLSLSLAIVSHAFPVEQQGQALGIWAAVSALALAIGPLVGGVLIDVDWRLIFWINLPICAAGIADHPVGGAGVPRRDLAAQARLSGPRHPHPGSAGGRVRPGPGGQLGLGIRQDARPAGGWAAPARRLLGDRAPGPLADRRLQPLPQRPLPRGLGGRLRAGRRLLGGDLLPAPVPAGGPRPRARRGRSARAADHGTDGLHLALLRPADQAPRAPRA